MSGLGKENEDRNSQLVKKKCLRKKNKGWLNLEREEGKLGESEIKGKKIVR